MVRVIFSLLLVMSLTSCIKQQNEEFQGVMFYENDEPAYVIITQDNLSFRGISFQPCDTFLSERFVANYNKALNKYLLIRKRDTVGFTVKNRNQGRDLCISLRGETQCFTINSDPSYMKLAKRKAFGNDHALGIKVRSSIEELDRLRTLQKYSNDAQEVINYIDSLKLSIYQELKIDTTELNCIKYIDSLHSYRALTDFLVDEPANPKKDHFSAHGLKLKITKYLNSYDDKSTIDLFFKYYSNDAFPGISNKYGMIESWETYYFYGVPLWMVILQLNEFQSSIMKLDALKNNS